MPVVVQLGGNIVLVQQRNVVHSTKALLPYRTQMVFKFKQVSNTAYLEAYE